MSKIFSAGSGITAEHYIGFLDDEIGGDPALIKAAFAKQRSFTGYLDAAESDCKAILAKASLPTSRSLEFKNGAWIPDEPTKPKSLSELKGRHFANRRFVILDKLNVAIDSPQGFSVRVLEIVDHLRDAIANGKSVEIAEKAYRLGSLTTQWQLKRLADRGLAQTEAARKNFRDSNESRQQEAAFKWIPAREEAARLRAEHPDWRNETRIAKTVKKNLKLSDGVAQIARAIK